MFMDGAEEWDILKGEGKLTLLGIVVTDSVVNVREIYRLHNLKNSWNLAVLFHGWV